MKFLFLYSLNLLLFADCNAFFTISTTMHGLDYFVPLKKNYLYKNNKSVHTLVYLIVFLLQSVFCQKIETTLFMPLKYNLGFSYSAKSQVDDYIFLL